MTTQLLKSVMSPILSCPRDWDATSHFILIPYSLTALPDYGIMIAVIRHEIVYKIILTKRCLQNRQYRLHPELYTIQWHWLATKGRKDGLRTLEELWHHNVMHDKTTTIHMYAMCCLRSNKAFYYQHCKPVLDLTKPSITSTVNQS